MRPTSRRAYLVAAAVAALAGVGLVASRANRAAPEPAAASAGPPEHVVLLHGLGRSKVAMRELERRLQDAGYVVHNISYPSREETPEKLVSMIGEKVAACCANTKGPTHFVTHSLGGLLLRAYLADKPLKNLGRVVMLGPPNQGSDLVDKYGDTWLFRKALGPTAARLGTKPDSLPNLLGPPYYEVGIIAGNASFNPISSNLIPGEDDGVVAVEATKLEGMVDFLVLNTSHTMMRRDPEVAAETLHFLKHGRFSRSSMKRDR